MYVWIRKHSTDVKSRKRCIETSGTAVMLIAVMPFYKVAQFILKVKATQQG